MEDTASETHNQQFSKDTQQNMTPPNEIMFFSFGLFIIDSIQFPPPLPPKSNLPGGGGLYALLGARLLTPPPYSRSLSWILDLGNDIPPSHPIPTQLNTWQTSLRTRRDENRLTTRAWNGYGLDASRPEFREFKYTTPKKRLEVIDLNEAELASRGWHMVCSAQRCADIMGKLNQQWKSGTGREARTVVWEPIPDLCTPEELHGVSVVAKEVEVVSPNAEELGMFFSGEDGVRREEMVKRLVGWDYDSTSKRSRDHGDGESRSRSRVRAVVVREGKDGSTVYFPPDYISTSTSTSISSSTIRSFHLPAYHDTSVSSRVVDPTGGGNTYLGALAVTLAFLSQNTEIPRPTRLVQEWVERVCEEVEGRGWDKEEREVIIAAVCACISAGFAIEQNGVPGLDLDVGTEDSEKGERWGERGEGVEERIRFYLEREEGWIRRELSASGD